jgi:hypothetical protein
VKLALAILAAVLLLAGCGGQTKAPYAGTWQTGPHGDRVVIAPVANEFAATMIVEGQAVAVANLRRHGTALVGSMKEPYSQMYPLTIAYLPAFRWATHSRNDRLAFLYYVIYRPRFIYQLRLEAQTPRWASTEPVLNAVAQTFTVRPSRICSNSPVLVTLRICGHLRVGERR